MINFPHSFFLQQTNKQTICCKRTATLRTLKNNARCCFSFLLAQKFHFHVFVIELWGSFSFSIFLLLFFHMYKVLSMYTTYTPWAFVKGCLENIIYNISYHWFYIFMNFFLWNSYNGRRFACFTFFNLKWLNKYFLYNVWKFFLLLFCCYYYPLIKKSITTKT